MVPADLNQFIRQSVAEKLDSAADSIATHRWLKGYLDQDPAALVASLRQAALTLRREDPENG